MHAPGPRPRSVAFVRPRPADPAQDARPGRRLYGRERETEALAAALDSLAAGNARLLSLEGAPGAGKSTLLAWAQDDARRRGWTVLSGRAAVLETANDFGVLRQVLAELPPLPDGRPAAVLGPVPADTSPFQVFERVSAHLLDIATRDTVLIALDDLQWCDAPSLRWLAYLAHRTAGLPLALLLTDSPGDVSEYRPLADELAARCERQALHRLTEAPLRLWIADVLGAIPAEAFVEGCLEATGGNGALLTELLTALAARFVPPAQQSLEQLESVGTVAVSRRVMPWIKRGGPAALAVAQAVAILGEDSDPVLVAELAGLKLDEAARAVDQLIKLDILTDTSPLGYVHSLTRAAVATDMNAGLRTSLRLRASHLVRDHCAGPERAAAHLMAVDMAAEPHALDTLRVAASAALDSGRPDSALGYLRRALAEPMPDSTRAELLASVGAVEAGLGVASAGNSLRRALSLAADPSLRVQAAVDLAYVDATAGNPLRSALDFIDEACAQLPPGELAGEAELGVFLAYTASGDASEFFALRLPRLRELVRDDARLATLAEMVDAWADTQRGCNRDECVHRTLSALAAVDRHNPRELRLRWPAVSMLIDAEQYDLAETGDRFAHRQGPTGDIALSALLRGRLAYGRGDLKGARSELKTALDDPSAAEAAGVVQLIRVLTDLGDLEAAEQLIQNHVPTVPAGQTWAAAALTFAKAALLMTRNQHREALPGFLEAGRILDTLGIDNPGKLHWRSRAARCHALLGNETAATRLAEEEVGLARRWGAPRAMSTALAAAGLVALDRDAAIEAVGVLDGTVAESHRAAALVDLGAVQWKTGATDQADHYLQDGYALARTIGARPVWLRAARYIKHAGGRPDLSRISGASALTAQERAAAGHAASGASNRQIADEMVLTQRTVEQYLTSAYRKLGITGRSQLADALPR
jgi:DNA-binding CsgD family transcriptional regulator